MTCDRVPMRMGDQPRGASSTVLAVATRVARREGLPLPIPSTNLFPDLPEAQRRIPAAISAAGVALRRFEIEEASLEDVFVELVGGPRQ